MSTFAKHLTHGKHFPKADGRENANGIFFAISSSARIEKRLQVIFPDHVANSENSLESDG